MAGVMVQRNLRQRRFWCAATWIVLVAGQLSASVLPGESPLWVSPRPSLSRCAQPAPTCIRANGHHRSCHALCVFEQAERGAVDIEERRRTWANRRGVVAGRAERNEVFERCRPARSGDGGDVEVEPLDPESGHERRSAPGDLRSGSVGRLDCSFLILIPDQRPLERGAPETAECVGAVAVHRAEPWAAGQEAAVRIDDAELVAFRVGEHDVGVGRVLTDVDVCRTQVEELRHGGGLIIGRRGCEIEVDPVLTDLHSGRRSDEQAEAGGIGRHEVDGTSIGIAWCPAQCVRPEPGQLVGCSRLQRERNEP